MNKRNLTQQIIDNSNINITIKKAYDLWWYKDSNDNNFRLTRPGYLQFNDLTPNKSFKHEFTSTPNNFKQLSYLNCPYYIPVNVSGFASEISIFSTKAITAIALYGSFERYLSVLRQS